jgi:hypothetical protein
MTAPNLNPRRLRFPADRTSFIYQGSGLPILMPAGNGVIIYTDSNATTLANITYPDTTPIPDSKIFIANGLLPEFYGPTGHVLRVYARSVGSVGAPYPLDAQPSDISDATPLLVAGPGAPNDAMGTYGSMYIDTLNQLLYGPKTVTWPTPGVPLSGSGGGGGSTSYIFTQSSPSASWTITNPFAYRPLVEIIDSAGNVVVGDITYPASPTLTPIAATFSAPFAGTAVLR